MAKKIFHTKAEVVREKADAEQGIVEAIVGSSDVVDRMGDIIDQDGWILKNFKKNPVILWGHNVREERPPIGTALKVWLEKAGKKSKLMFKVKFDLQDTFAAEIFRKVKAGFINTVSVGFHALEWESLDKDDEFFGGRKYLKQELLELSFVPIPANPEAVVALRSLSQKDSRFKPMKSEDVFPSQKAKKAKKVKKVKTVKKETKVKEKPIKEVLAKKVPAKKKEKAVKVKKDEIKKKKIVKVIKKVVPFKDLGILPESEPWDGSGERAKADVTDLKLMSAWFDDKKPDSKSSYKLPHHKADGHKAVWRGVAAAMAALLGARGGVDIPESGRRGVYNHLKKHYKQFDKKAPDFKMVEDQVLAELEDEVHSLALDREDKYAVRLIKKVLKKQGEKKNKSAYTPEHLRKALEVINLALSLYKKGSTKKGGANKG